MRVVRTPRLPFAALERRLRAWLMDAAVLVRLAAGPESKLGRAAARYLHGALREADVALRRLIVTRAIARMAVRPRARAAHPHPAAARRASRASGMRILMRMALPHKDQGALEQRFTRLRRTLRAARLWVARLRARLHRGFVRTRMITVRTPAPRRLAAPPRAVAAPDSS